MDMERFERQLAFIIEVDKMKHVLRRTLLTDGSRRENDAEHSWHMALAAAVLQEYAASATLDMGHVLKMIIFHDIVEVYAGDTFAYDAAANADKEQREQEAAARIFGMLPEDQAQEFRALWEEFDAMETPDSLYAAAMDRLQPLIHNYMTQGHTWREGNVTTAQVYARNAPIKKAAPALWAFVERTVQWGLEQGYLRE